MDAANQPTIAAILAEFDRRLRALERNPRLQQSSIRDGGLNVYDDSNVLAARLGSIGDGTPVEAGITLYDPVGAELLKIGRVGSAGNEVSVRGIDSYGWSAATIGRFDDYSDVNTARTGVRVADQYLSVYAEVSSERGWEAPGWAIPARLADQHSAVTSGSFFTAWRADARYLQSRYAFIQATVLTDAGTTGDLRVQHGSQTSSTQSIGAGTSTTFEWRVSFADSNFHQFVLQARRTGGAGSVRVYEPLIVVGRPDDGVATAMT